MQNSSANTPNRRQRKRRLSLLDQLITQADNAIRTLSPGEQTPSRQSPAQTQNEAALTDQDRKHSAGLMRVNHAGEVCAQALYQGQALTAKLGSTRAEMEDAAKEEVDHLAWCQQRLDSLDSRPSLLNPVWYGLSFSIGATAGLISDRVSLGFVAATEEQVCKHLEKHLQELPKQDERSRAVVQQMLIDENRHAETALEAGGHQFPKPVKAAMTLISKAMTETSYRL